MANNEEMIASIPPIIVTRFEKDGLLLDLLWFRAKPCPFLGHGIFSYKYFFIPIKFPALKMN